MFGHWTESVEPVSLDTTIMFGNNLSTWLGTGIFFNDPLSFLALLVFATSLYHAIPCLPYGTFLPVFPKNISFTSCQKDSEWKYWGQDSKGDGKECDMDGK